MLSEVRPLSRPLFRPGRSASVLFVDPTCTAPYTQRTLFERAMEGPAATVVRVAEGLAQRGHRVTVAQKGRMWPEKSPGGVRFVPFDHAAGAPRLAADAVVVVRQHKVLRRLRRLHPGARLFLWAHDFPGSRAKRLGLDAAAAQATVVAVSEVHRAALTAFLRERGHRPDGRPVVVPVARVYNPVDDALTPAPAAVDPDKLVFLSSPHKGLDAVLGAFARVRAVRPTARLLVADPGYWTGERPALPDGVVRLGPLPHHAVMRHVREAFCVFYPQASFAETFGLVFAEANAVGTPVIAHPGGAAQEVLGESAADARQLVDASDPEAAVARLSAWWAEGRPEVRARSPFRLQRVLDDWERLVGAARPSAERPFPSVRAVAVA